jgi:hypothetical protein
VEQPYRACCREHGTGKGRHGFTKLARELWPVSVLMSWAFASTSPAIAHAAAAPAAAAAAAIMRGRYMCCRYDALSISTAVLQPMARKPAHAQTHLYMIIVAACRRLLSAGYNTKL